MAKHFYIAYGSNLNTEQMQFRCPTARPLGTAILRDRRLSFRGSKTGAYLTVDPCPGAEVPVAVWEVRDEDVLRLDRYEGYPDFYDREETWITYRGLRTRRQRTVKAFVYVMTGERPCGIPSNGYMRTCLEGYDAFGFSRRILFEAYTRCVKEVRNEA